MKRKIIQGAIVMASILFATTGFASELDMAPQKFDGFYIGAGVGAGQLNSDVHVETSDKDYDLDKITYTGNIFTGFGKSFNSVYLGAELFMNHIFNNSERMSSRDPSKSDSYDFNTEKRSSVGCDFRLGYVANNIMPYILLGVERANFAVSGDLPDGGGGFIPANDSEDGLGIIAGLGIEGNVMPNFFVRLQYVYSSFANLDDFAFASAVNRYQNDIDQHNVSLDFIYRF